MNYFIKNKIISLLTSNEFAWGWSETVYLLKIVEMWQCYFLFRSSIESSNKTRWPV